MSVYDGPPARQPGPADARRGTGGMEEIRSRFNALSKERVEIAYSRIDALP